MDNRLINRYTELVEILSNLKIQIKNMAHFDFKEEEITVKKFS